MKDSDWKVYRTRFLVRAQQLSETLYFVDPLGREHHGVKGDYLIEFSDGARRIAPRLLFEDIYVAMEGFEERWPAVSRRDWGLEESRRPTPARRALAS